jgi:hypothetical protein
MSFHSGHCPASTSCSVCPTSSSGSRSLFRLARSQPSAAVTAALTHNFRLPLCRCSSKFLLLLFSVAVVALILVLLAVSSSTHFAFSSLFYFSRVAIWTSSHCLLSGRSVKLVDESVVIGISLFILALPPVAQSFLQSLSITSSASLGQQSVLRWTAFPHCQHTGHPYLWCSASGSCVPTGALITSCSLAGGPAATSSWRASLSNLPLPMRRCCFSSLSLTLLTNAWFGLPHEQSPQVTWQGPDAPTARWLLEWLTTQLGFWPWVEIYRLSPASTVQYHDAN